MRRLVYFAAAVMAAGLGSAAQAETRLVSATPPANSTVAKPSSIQLRFSGKLMPKLSRVDLFMTAMSGHAHPPMKISGGKTSFSADGKTMIMRLAQPLSAGTYRVDYHGVSVDTHKAHGSYTFHVK